MEGLRPPLTHLWPVPKSNERRRHWQKYVEEMPATTVSRAKGRHNGYKWGWHRSSRSRHGWKTALDSQRSLKEFAFECDWHKCRESGKILDNYSPRHLLDRHRNTWPVHPRVFSWWPSTWTEAKDTSECAKISSFPSTENPCDPG